MKTRRIVMSALVCCALAAGCQWDSYDDFLKGGPITCTDAPDLVGKFCAHNCGVITCDEAADPHGVLICTDRQICTGFGEGGASSSSSMTSTTTSGSGGAGGGG